MFNPSYVPKVTPVAQLQAMGLGRANPEEFSLPTALMVFHSCVEERLSM
jgi:hypothetical protein